ncbi:tetratricopeptide repeat protein [Cognatilysobacter bugurensis]|uniref:Cytochrome c biogenesis protein n=1 Tax=Cognatilysobacter bugurensis TaxID=543356 RepID=A0A918SV36_9GAMM|nr:cytochrome C biogenesis protein [Lysobacter bugurensis]GHA71358.1 cytochrome c biogenesis protein [Lysobacter bugurensis]
MTAFALASALLVLATLAFVTRPLWRPRIAPGLAVTLMLACTTALLYFAIGTPAALDPAQRVAPATMSDAIAQLQLELERNPDQPEGWRVLARALANEGRSREALAAYAEAIERAPDAEVLTEAAETRARAHPQRLFDDAAVAMLRRALQLQPAHQRARWFLGISQRQAGQAADAARTWEPLLAVVDPSTAATLRPQIDAARAAAGLDPLSPADPAPAGGLEVQVALAPALAASLPANATVFVIARAPGTVMPVAVERVEAASFPLTVQLDDGDSPMPTARLSQLPRVEVLARVSLSGQASAQPGDLASAPVAIDNAAGARVETTIDRKVP